LLKLSTTLLISILLTSLFFITPITSNAATASYYGKGFHGKQTASGEIFNKWAMTTASNSHKMGTILEVTNVDNNKKIRVRVNDRGGFSKYGRTLDLSRGAFAKIADLDKGLCKVKIRVIK